MDPQCVVSASLAVLCDGLPGTDHLFHCVVLHRIGTVLLLLVPGVNGVDSALGRDVHFDLKETVNNNQQKLVAQKRLVHILSQLIKLDNN